MRTAFVVAAVVGVGLFARTAFAGQSHYLSASAFDQFTAAKAVQPPDLTPSIDVTHAVGVSGSPPFFQNHSSVDTDSLHLLVSSVGGQPVGPTTSFTPAEWKLGAHFEEVAKPGTPAATGMTATMKIDATGMIASLNDTPVTLKLTAQLVVNQCRIIVDRHITPTASGDLVATNNCNARGASARLEGSALIINVDELFSTTSIEATVSGAFIGQKYEGSHDFNVKADVIVQPRGGSLTFTSPTFGSKAASTPEGTTDGGSNVPPGGDAGSTSSSSGGADGGSNAAAATGDDSGCNVGASSSTTTSIVGLVLAAAALLRRRRTAA